MVYEKIFVAIGFQLLAEIWVEYDRVCIEGILGSLLNGNSTLMLYFAGSRRTIPMYIGPWSCRVRQNSQTWFVFFCFFLAWSLQWWELLPLCLSLNLTLYNEFSHPQVSVPLSARKQCGLLLFVDLRDRWVSTLYIQIRKICFCQSLTWIPDLRLKLSGSLCVFMVAE